MSQQNVKMFSNKIVNPRRLRQIEEFIDRYHQIIHEYYNIIDEELEVPLLKRRMRQLIKKDPNFFDPYLSLVDCLQMDGDYFQAKKILRAGYENAMRLIVDKEGRWPKVMEWAYLQNRHLIRVIDRWAYELWEGGKYEEALEIFRNLLKTNPGDNIGARYSILALKMGLNTSYEDQFLSPHIEGYIDGMKISNWFEENSKRFPEEFAWWWNEMDKNDKKT